jgi:2-deoxy-D-gluconate 3-dehydrogenase
MMMIMMMMNITICDLIASMEDTCFIFVAAHNYSELLCLTDFKKIDTIIQELLNKKKIIDGLVNNAGIIHRQDSLDYEMAAWQNVINTNLTAVFYLSQQIARNFLISRGGKIINIASMLSFQGGLRVPAYTASKSAIKGLTMALANEWAKYSIQVNAIAPGYFDTKNTTLLREDKLRNQAIIDRIPQGRWGQPKDLAGSVIFLASKASDYVTGITLPVDGGWLGR